MPKGQLNIKVSLPVFCILVAMFIVYLPASYLFSAQKGFIAFGEIRGNVDPCGCNPESDLGGINRIAQSITLERKINPEILVISTGNNFDPGIAGKLKKYTFDDIGTGADTEKNQAIQNFLGALKSQGEMVLAANLTELRNKDFLNAFKNEIVLSNYKVKGSTGDNGSHPGFSPLPFYENEKFIVYNLINYDAPELIPVAQLPLDDWKKNLKAKDKKHSILIYSGDTVTAFFKNIAGIFDEIILGNERPFTDEPVGLERTDESMLNVEVLQSRYLKIPMGGQGLLRGGNLRMQRPADLSFLLKGRCAAGLTASCSQGSEGETEALFSGIAKGECSSGCEMSKTTYFPFTWLDRSIDEFGEPIPSYQSYLERKANKFAQGIASRLKAKENSGYVGSKSCQPCHIEAYQIWEKSRHGSALETLVGKKQDQNGECVKCHVVGFEKGGFVSKEHTPDLAGVGCEQCHGPRKDHITNPTVSTSPKGGAKNICSSCHHAPHSLAFLFEKYWPKIEHKGIGQK